MSLNPWLVLDSGYSMMYDGMESEVEWEELDDDEEYEEPEFYRGRYTPRKNRTLLIRR